MMSTTIEEGRHWADELERLAEHAPDPLPLRKAAEALRNLSRLAEGLFEDLDDFGRWIERAAKAIGATGCPVDRLHAVVRYAESAAPYFRFTETSGALQAPKLDEFGNAHYCRSG